MLTKLEFAPPISVNTPNTKFYENPSSRSRALSCRRIDSQTDMTGLIVAIHHIANESQKNTLEPSEN
jgi:hypothetical protein